jgi:predicted fused transcriptional regulator/phosphomethylpyrimidine kinase
MENRHEKRKAVPRIDVNVGISRHATDPSDGTRLRGRIFVASARLEGSAPDSVGVSHTPQCLISAIRHNRPARQMGRERNARNVWR